MLLLRFILIPAVCIVANEDYPFRNPKLSWSERLNDIIERLTIEEIASQTTTGYQRATSSVPRLGIKSYVWNTECIHGQMTTNSTAFPQSLGLAASFR